MPTQRADTTLPIKVTYEDGEPREIEYYHIAQGLMRFEMVGSTAVVDDEWNDLRDDATAKRENVVDAVRNLPFVQAVDA